MAHAMIETRMDPFELVLPHKTDSVPLLIVCDHASNRLPPAYETLGLPAPSLETHIAYDIGAASAARALSEFFGAPAVLARWSRLLIDLNRGEDDPTLVMKLSDGVIVPGNAGAGDGEVASRLTRFHRPYHDKIALLLRDLSLRGVLPAVVSVHSFTPEWKGARRPWELGVLWDRDARLARPLIAALARAGFTVGDNEPYSGALQGDTLYRHGTMNGLAHALIEIRQDLVHNEGAAREIAARLAPALSDALAALGSAHISLSRPIDVKGHPMDEATQTALEAAVFRRLVAHLRERTNVQNIDLMIAGGFCRNCLGDWYREAAADRGITLAKDEARAVVYGMAPTEWKKRFQKEATPEQQAAFERSQAAHR